MILGQRASLRSWSLSSPGSIVASQFLCFLNYRLCFLMFAFPDFGYSSSDRLTGRFWGCRLVEYGSLFSWVSE